MWDTKDPFRFKTMKYQQSCFPCSLQVILHNLGYVGQDDSIEDCWERLHRENTGSSLDQQAPTEEQLHSYLARTPELGNRGVIFSPAHFDEDTVEAIVERVNRDFINAAGPVGMIAGIGHATVFFKDADNNMYHLNPSPARDSTLVERVDALQAGAIPDTTGREWAVLLEGNSVRLAAQFLMIIS